MDDIQKLNLLKTEQLQEIEALEKACVQVEPLQPKLNWDMLAQPQASQSLYLLAYREGVLVGFLGLYAIDPTGGEIELTGMVHPDYRRRGIFGKLYAVALAEIKARKIPRVLLIAEQAAAAGTHFAQAVGGQYTVSEYRMCFSGALAPAFPRHGLRLRKANRQDFDVLQQLDAVSFGSAMAELPPETAERYYGSTYVGELDGKIIGKIGIDRERAAGYIFGFGIRPECRGQGFGRELLGLMMLRCMEEQIRPVLLEVAVTNEKALTLYRSCGFEVMTVYQYYQINLD